MWVWGGLWSAYYDFPVLGALGATLAAACAVVACVLPLKRKPERSLYLLLPVVTFAALDFAVRALAWRVPYSWLYDGDVTALISETEEVQRLFSASSAAYWSCWFAVILCFLLLFRLVCHQVWDGLFDGASVLATALIGIVLLLPFGGWVLWLNPWPLTSFLPKDMWAVCAVIVGALLLQVLLGATWRPLESAGQGANVRRRIIGALLGATACLFMGLAAWLSPISWPYMCAHSPGGGLVPGLRLDLDMYEAMNVWRLARYGSAVVIVAPMVGVFLRAGGTPRRCWTALCLAGVVNLSALFVIVGTLRLIVGPVPLGYPQQPWSSLADQVAIPSLSSPGQWAGRPTATHVLRWTSEGWQETVLRQLSGGSRDELVVAPGALFGRDLPIGRVPDAHIGILVHNPIEPALSSPWGPWRRVELRNDPGGRSVSSWPLQKIVEECSGHGMFPLHQGCQW